MSKSLFNDLKRYSFTYVILCVSMMPLIGDGYSMYILICLLPIVLKQTFSNSSFLVLFYSLFYTISFVLRGEELATSKMVFYSIFPIIAFSCGQLLGMRLSLSKAIIFVIASLVFCLAAPGIYYGILDVFNSGQLVKISRDVEYAEGSTISATGYGLMFSLAIAGIGLINFPAEDKFDKRIKLFLIALSLLAIFCTIHILNRTGIVLAIIAIFTSVFTPPHNKKRFVYTLAVGIIILIIVFYCLADTPLMDDAVQGYLSREENEANSVSTGGGRYARWGNALIQILMYPLGCLGVLVDGEYTYAHNLWLDAGLRGGIIPFILLIIIGFNIIKSTLFIIKHGRLDYFKKAYLGILCAVMFAQAMTEPVIESVYQFFLFMIFYYGCVTALCKRSKFIE